MQEQIDRESVAITVKAAKLTGRVLAKAFMAVVHKIQNEQAKAQTPHGKQSVKKLMNHNVSTSTIPLDGDTKLFDRVARKWNVDYAFHKTDKNKYLLLFKAGQTDAITAAFKEYSALVMKRARDKRPPVMEQFNKAAELVKQQILKPLERRKEREAMRDDR